MKQFVAQPNTKIETNCNPTFEKTNSRVFQNFLFLFPIQIEAALNSF
ncbi:hypothetical protein LEP1GSC039_0665 [Leptospira santarosai str. 2000027870]|nr:hypothetical protein LEP1GSC039_0665 [Leptospira santarosai str. 2000027870]